MVDTLQPMRTPETKQDVSHTVSKMLIAIVRGLSSPLRFGKGAQDYYTNAQEYVDKIALPAMEKKYGNRD